MKIKHYLFLAGGYLVVAYVVNRYVTSPTGFKLPLDLIGNTGIGY